MSATATGVQVYIGATTGDLSEGLQQAISEVRGAVSQLRQHMSGVKPATQEAGKEVESLGDKMRAFAREQRREAGTARYFVNEFASFVPEGSKMKDVLGGLTSGLVGGGGFGLAIEAVTLGVKWFTDAMKEDEERMLASAKATHDLAAARHALAADMEQSSLNFYKGFGGFKQGSAEKFVEDATAGAKAKLDALDAQYNAKMAEVETARDEAKRARAKGAGLDEYWLKQADDAAKAAAQLLEQWGDAQRAYQAQRDAAQAAAPMFLRDKDKFEGTSAIAIAQANAERVKAIGLGDQENENARYQVELLRLQASLRKATTPEEQSVVQAQMSAAAAEHQSNLARIEDKRVLARINAELAQEQEEANERGQALVYSDQSAAREKKRAEDLAEWMREFRSQVATWEADDRAKEWEKKKKDLEEQAGFYESIGQRIGNTIGQAFAKGMTPLEAMGSLLKSTFQEIIAFAQKHIMASALEASAEAAKSQAGIPVVGPILAGAAMVAMLGMVGGLTSSLPSAAGGWTIPRGIDPIVQAHGGEHIIPADIAQKYEDGAPGGGRGDTFHVTTMDAASFEAWLRRGGMDVIERERARRRRDGRSA